MILSSLLRKATVSVLSVALLLTIVSPFSVFASTEDVSYAAHKESHHNPLISLNPPRDFNENVSTMGLKTKGLLKVIQALNCGGKKLVDSAIKFNLIDEQTGKTLVNNSKKIVNFLTKLDGAAEDIASKTREQLPQWLLNNTEIKDTKVAQNIAKVIAWAIRAADWLLL
ncbi:hypothetical protein DQX05_07110 [Paenibacillus thiaminolyticus]|uniref:Uncharacterized protein n=2 Tax=Paenibacillus thiaminolyticus TaxID=49283 RepID=A0A3A3GK40_PANTH|nr:hypothetical protein DQX05_07110 [Paenibacillus thiaminolyticus]